MAMKMIWPGEGEGGLMMIVLVIRIIAFFVTAAGYRLAGYPVFQASHSNDTPIITSLW